MTRLRVLQISNYFYPNIGGIEQVARDIVLSLKTELDIEQKVICFNENASDGSIVCKRAETKHDDVDGVEIIRCGCFAKVRSQSLSLPYRHELSQIMDTFAPNLVIFHYPNPFVASILLEHCKRDFKLILYWHLDITKQRMLRYLFHKQNLRLIDRADRIVGATPMHVNQSYYSEAFQDKKEVLPYAIDEQRLIISAAEMDESNRIKARYANQIIAFTIGRHVHYKGLRYLIEASKLLGKANIVFIIAGEGELTQTLKEQAQGDEKVLFVGRISDSQWRAYLQACDIFCFPSITRNEAFGLAQAEAMSYGKPVVTFTIAHSGVNYVNLDGVTGIQCPNADAAAYASALKRLMESEDLRRQYGLQAKKRVQDNFSAEMFKGNLKKLLNTVLATAPKQ